MCATKRATQTIDVIEAPNETEETQKPKRRVRKSTTSAKSTSSRAATRGRPKKEVVPETESEPVVDTAIEVQAEKPAPKRRGRKPRATKTASQEVEKTSEPEFVMTKEALDSAYRDKELMDAYADMEPQQEEKPTYNPYSFGSSGTSLEIQVTQPVSEKTLEEDATEDISDDFSHKPQIDEAKIEREMKLIQEFIDKVTPDDFVDSEDDKIAPYASETYRYPPDVPVVSAPHISYTYTPHDGAVGYVPKERTEHIAVISRPQIQPVEARKTASPLYPNYIPKEGALFERAPSETYSKAPAYRADPSAIFNKGMEVPEAFMVLKDDARNVADGIPKYQSVLPGMPRPFSDNSTGKQLGKEGEALAARFLAARGYLILELNWRTQSGEVDIICEQGDTTVLVEVKTRRQKAGETDLVWPELNFDTNKYQRYMYMMNEYRRAFKGVKDIRVDVIGIVVKDNHRCNLRHILNVFDSWELDNGKRYSSY